MPSEFSEEEAKLLSRFFTNMDKPIFALRNLPEVVKGALFSRYSRTDKSLRRVLLDEFISKQEMGFKEIVSFAAESGEDEMIATRKAEEFYDRVLVGYGDDSVAELGGAHIACENVSNIATKIMEDARIGISPLEKSSRYVYFNEKVGGNYRYWRDPAIMDSEFADLYVQTMDMLFDSYSKLIEPMKKFIIERHPQGDASDRAYAFTIRAKACDVLRVFLPAGTLTNMGMFGNGRAFEYLLTKMYSNDLAEIRQIAQQMQVELSKVIPSFVKRSNDQYGIATQQFWADTRHAIEQVVSEQLPLDSDKAEEVELIEWDEDAENKIVVAILYPQSTHPLHQLRRIVENMLPDQRKKIIDEYVSRRQNRRHRPGRAFEHAHYTFDLLGNYGGYRDLQRHRVLTQERQDLTIKHGYDTPPEMVEAGFIDDYRQAMEAARGAFLQISRKFPKEAQYVVPFGYRLRWYFHLNLRELYHLVELRTMQQGHPDYRRICQEMFRQVRTIHPRLVEHMRFVDMKSYDLERMEAEKRLDKKMEEMARKYGASP